MSRPKYGRYWHEQTWVRVIMWFIGIGLAVAAIWWTDANSPTPAWEIREDKVRQCIADGGDPRYAVNRYGQVESYFGCIKP